VIPLAPQPIATSAQVRPPLLGAGGSVQASQVRHERLVPLRLFEGEDDALVDVASFELAVGVGSLLHWHGLVRAQAEPTIGQRGHCVIQGTRSLGSRDGRPAGFRVSLGEYVGQVAVKQLRRFWQCDDIGRQRRAAGLVLAAELLAPRDPHPDRRHGRRSGPGELPASDPDVVGSRQDVAVCRVL
jgi:hypothetical protein